VPSAPGRPTPTPGNALVKLTWAASASTGGATIDHYYVYRLSGSSWSLVATVAGTARAATVSALTNGTTYGFRLRAHNSVGYSPYGESALAAPRTVPGAPTWPTAVASSSSVQVRWGPPVSTGGAKPDLYRVQRLNDATWTTLADMTGVSYLNTGLVNGSAYSYRVFAHNVAGWGAASASTTATPSAAPGPPTGLTVTPGEGDAALSWTAPADTGGMPVTYRIERSADDGSTWTTVADVPGTSFADAVDHGSFAWRVRTLNTVAASDPSGNATATVVDEPDAPPTCSAVYTPSDYSAGSIQVSWTYPASDGGQPLKPFRIDGFDYLYGGNTSSASGYPPATSVTVSNYNNNYWGPNGQRGHFEIRAVNAVGLSAICSAPVV
jgi:titin